MFVFGILFLAGIAGGILASVVGMASLVSYPILLATGLSPIVANVTNTAALIFSGIGATISSKKELRNNARDLLWILPVALVGSLLGCLLLLAFPSKIFEKIVPFMIVLAAVFFILQPYLHRNLPHSTNTVVHVKRTFLTCLAILLIGAYGGYFGAASGIFMLLVLSMTEGMSLIVANALKNVIMGSTNLIATIVYIFYGHINWPHAILMGAGFIIGGYVGPVIARHLPRQVLRWVIIIGGFVLAFYMFYTAYL